MRNARSTPSTSLSRRSRNVGYLSRHHAHEVKFYLQFKMIGVERHEQSMRFFVIIQLWDIETLTQTSNPEFVSTYA